MQRIYQYTKVKILPILAVAVFIGVSATFSIAGAQKLISSSLNGKNKIAQIGKSSKVLIQANETNQKFAENNQDTSTHPRGGLIAQAFAESLANLDTDSNDDIKQNNVINTSNSTTTSLTNKQNQNNQNNNNGTVFTTASLATHNKVGDCYIAYKGTVYNLSNSSAWANCQHHGATGGIDITAIFPHPTSYFNSLPVVGTLGTASTNTNNNNNNQNSGSTGTKKTWKESENKQSHERENESEEYDD